MNPVSYTHLRAHETPEHLVCRLLLEKNVLFMEIYIPMESSNPSQNIQLLGEKGEEKNNIFNSH